MRKNIVYFLLLFVTIGYSQSYKFGAGYANGITFKVVGSLMINDKKVIFETFNKDIKDVKEYDLIKNVNGIVYFTDGVMTHFFTFVKDTGKKKGFDYDTLVIFNFDKSQSNMPVTYYCKLQE